MNLHPPIKSALEYYTKLNVTCMDARLGKFQYSFKRNF